jgi:3-oxoacyl-[acyl-carrier-protein] synthase II
MSDSRRLDDPIVVTGMGVLAAQTASPRELYEVALGGSSVGAWLNLDGLRAPIAASQAPDPHLSGPEFRHARRLDRAAQLGLAAAQQAITQARLNYGVDPTLVSVVMGTSRGPIGRTVQAAHDLERGAVTPAVSAETTLASLSGVISQVFGYRGSSSTLTATCASAAQAICVGAIQLLAGEAEAVVVGGAEAPLIPLMASQLTAARVTGWDADPRLTCKPFDARRNGLMMGEGAAVLVLERASAAERRGSQGIARLSGWACGSDDGGRTGVNADGEGLVRVVRRSLERARIPAAAIGHVNAHGTATVVNDLAESRALNTVFGQGSVPPLTSTKPITGHCLGATPAIEAVLAIETLRDGRLPPTANHLELDAGCAVDVVSGEPRPSRIGAVLSTSLGFWGLQAALVFESI